MVDAGKWKPTFGTVTVIGIVMSLIGGIGQMLLAPGNKTLQISLRESEDERGRLSLSSETSYQTVFRDELYTLFGILGFGESERISLYHESSGTLIMLGRYSENTEFDKKGRGICNYGEGVLGSSWVTCNGRAFVNDLPEDAEDYAQKCFDDFGMDINIARKLRMKSRTICVRPIKNLSYNQKIAALVFESVNPNAFDQENIDKLMVQGYENQRMQRLLQTWERLIPDLNIASQEGV
jgi:hypothetical protein